MFFNASFTNLYVFVFGFDAFPLCVMRLCVTYRMCLFFCLRSMRFSFVLTAVFRVCFVRFLVCVLWLFESVLRVVSRRVELAFRACWLASLAGACLGGPPVIHWWRYIAGPLSRGLSLVVAPHLAIGLNSVF